MHLRQTVTYEPASRYWPLQWYETGIYLALALALAGLCLWWIRPRHFAAPNIRHRTSQPTPTLRAAARPTAQEITERDWSGRPALHSVGGSALRRTGVSFR